GDHRRECRLTVRGVAPETGAGEGEVRARSEGATPHRRDDGHDAQYNRTALRLIGDGRVVVPLPAAQQREPCPSCREGLVEKQRIREELCRPVRERPEEITSPDRVRPLDRPTYRRIRCATVVKGLQEPKGQARSVSPGPITRYLGQTKPLHRHLRIS